tara:strand:- start:2010 stop:3344 length:1335 start_codon:yes stop_codon:yes gene_type:complete
MNIHSKGPFKDSKSFLSWFRSVGPYIHAFKSKLFIICISSQNFQSNKLKSLINDIALMQALGIKIVITYNCWQKTKTQLTSLGQKMIFDEKGPVVDDLTLQCLKSSLGEMRMSIEALFSSNIPNTPMTNSKIKILSGNFVNAKPVGIHKGKDYKSAGLVNKIDGEIITRALNSSAIVLIPPLGFSATGETFSLNPEALAQELSSELEAEKLIFLVDQDLLPNYFNPYPNEISQETARSFFAESKPSEFLQVLHHANTACENGVHRVHIVPLATDGEILLELFTQNGVGLLLTKENLNYLRKATYNDVTAIHSLVNPYEKDGTLNFRGKLKIERDINNFSVLEHDGFIYGCAGLMIHNDGITGELYCLIVHPENQGRGEGGKILKHIESEARHKKLKNLLVKTTVAEHWFLKNGFESSTHASMDNNASSPNNNRKSKILKKTIKD